MNIVLASRSVFRQQQLSSLGLEFKCTASNVNEDITKKETLPPIELAKKLSRLKAQAVHQKNSDQITIGSDQLICFNNELLGKTNSLSECAQQLYKLSGHTHELITGLCVIYKDKHYEHQNKTLMSMKALTPEQCQNYVDHEKSHVCAGGYKIERSGIALFDKITTDDFTSIQGLPLMALVDILNKINYPLPFFRKQI